MSNLNNAPKDTTLEMVKHVMGATALLGNSFDIKSAVLKDKIIPGAIKIALSGDFTKAESILRARGGAQSNSDMMKFTEQEIREILDACTIYYGDKKQEIDDLRQGKIPAKTSPPIVHPQITPVVTQQANTSVVQNQSNINKNLKNKLIVTNKTNVTINKSQTTITNQTKKMSQGNLSSNQAKQYNQKKQSGNFVKPQFFTFRDKDGKSLIYEFSGETDKKGNIIIRQVTNRNLGISVSRQNYEAELKEAVEKIYGDVTIEKQKTPTQNTQKKPLETRAEVIKKQQKEFEDQVKDLEIRYKAAKGQEKKDLKTELENLKQELNLKKEYYNEALRAAVIREEIEKEKINLASAEAKNLGPEITKIKRKIKGLESDLEKAEALSDFHDKKYAFETAIGEEKKDAEKDFTKSTEKAINLGALPKPKKVGPEAEFEEKLEELKLKISELENSGNQIEATRQGLLYKKIEAESILLKITNLENVINAEKTIEANPDKKAVLEKLSAVLVERKTQTASIKSGYEKTIEVFESAQNEKDPVKQKELMAEFVNKYMPTMIRESGYSSMLELKEQILMAQREGKPKAEINKMIEKLAVLQPYEELRRDNVSFEYFLEEGVRKLVDEEKNVAEKKKLEDMYSAGIEYKGSRFTKEAILKKLVDINSQQEKLADNDSAGKSKIDLEKKIEEKNLAEEEKRLLVYKLRYEVAEAVRNGEDIKAISELKNKLKDCEEVAFKEKLLEKPKNILTEEQNKEIEKHAGSLGFKLEDLENIKDFDTLSYGQRLLVIDQFKQFTICKTSFDAKEIFEEKNRKAKAVAGKYGGFIGRLGVGMYRNIFKGYYQKRAEGAATKANREMIFEHKSEHIQTLTDQVKDFGYEVKVNDNGALEIQYANIPEGATNEEKKLYSEFNRVAMNFTNIPDEWRHNSATKKERKQYESVQAQYLAQRQKLLSSLSEKIGERDATIELAQLDQKLKGFQLNNTHPDATKELNRLVRGEKFSSAVLEQIKAGVVKIGYLGGGYASKTFLAGVFGYVAGPAVAAILGGVRGNARTREALKEQDKLMRKGGYKNKEQFLLEQIQNSKDQKTRDQFTKELTRLRDSGAYKKGLLNIKNKEAVGSRVAIDAQTWAVNLDNLKNKISEEQDPVKKDRLIAKLGTRVAYINQRLNEGQVSLGKNDVRLKNQLALVTAMTEATAMVTVSDQKVKEHVEEIYDNAMKRLSKVEQDTLKKRKEYVIQQTVKGAVVAAGIATVGVLAREYIEHLHGHGENPLPKTEPKPLIPPIKEPYVYKDLDPVQFSSRGGIQTVVNMKHELLREYAGVPDDQIPPAYLKIMHGNATELAKEFDWYRPNEVNESINMLKGSNISFEHGVVESNSIYNIHHVPQHEDLLDAKGNLGEGTDGPNLGPEDDERYFHYDNGHESGTHETNNEIHKMELKHPKLIEDNSSGKADPNHILEQKGSSGSGNKEIPKINSGKPYVIPGRVEGRPYVIGPNGISFNQANYSNLFGMNSPYSGGDIFEKLSDSDGVKDTIGNMSAYDILNNPDQYASTGNMGEAISNLQDLAKQAGVDPFHPSLLWGTETVKEYVDRIEEMDVA